LAALQRAQRLGGAFGAYTLQAAIAACHARARRMEDTDWTGIAALYAQLMRVAPSPVVELNRAVAVSRAQGAQAALLIVDALREVKQLRDYAPLAAVRGDLLFELGRLEEARGEFARAAELTANARERDVLMARAQSAPDIQTSELPARA
jgi:predicted RNA polymerase sigma factor